MDTEHAIRLIAQEWRTLLMRLDSAYPDWREANRGHLVGLAISQVGVLDRTIAEALRQIK